MFGPSINEILLGAFQRHPLAMTRIKGTNKFFLNSLCRIYALFMPRTLSFDMGRGLPVGTKSQKVTGGKFL